MCVPILYVCECVSVHVSYATPDNYHNWQKSQVAYENLLSNGWSE